MTKVLIAKCKQEISTFNPVLTHYEDFSIQRGQEVLDISRGVETEIAGAMEVFGQRDDIELVPAWRACANSSGSLVQEDFERLAASSALIPARSESSRRRRLSQSLARRRALKGAIRLGRGSA